MKTLVYFMRVIFVLIVFFQFLTLNLMQLWLYDTISFEVKLKIVACRQQQNSISLMLSNTCFFLSFLSRVSSKIVEEVL